jgi:L-ribulose-5-phosphate 3-epimerase
MKDYQIGLYEKAMPSGLSWREKFETAKEAGYDWLEISIDETDEKLARLDWDAAARRDFVRTMYDADLPVRTMCLSGHRKYPLGSEKPEIRSRSLSIMEKAVALASDLGIRLIQLAGYDVYYDAHTQQSEALFADGLAKAVEMASRAGVTLAFETMETPFMDTAAKAMRWVRERDSPWLQIYPDLGNLTNAALLYGGNALRDLETGRGHIAAMHLKETKPGVYREVPYGTGHVDFDAAIQKAQELGVRLFVTEFWYTGGADWRETIRNSKAFIDGKFVKNWA